MIVVVLGFAHLAHNKLIIANSMSGQKSENMFMTMSALAPLVAEANPEDTDLLVYSNHYQFCSGLGIPYLWISLKSY